MSNKYLNLNPVAQQFFSEVYRLNENENTDRLLDKIVVLVLDTFKKIVFDLSKDKFRNPDELREKLLDLDSAKTVRGLVSKMKDHAEESTIVDSKYSKTKQLYLKSLSKITDVLKRMVEIDPSIDDKALSTFKNLSDSLITSIDRIAVERMKRTNESESFILNEGSSMGFEGRIDSLRKKLVNLISSSKGKDSKSGFGRDWHRIFSQLNQKLESISDSNKIVSDKEKKALGQIEKEVDNLSREFFNSKVRATEVSIKQALGDDAFVTKFEDLPSMIEDSLDILSQANSEEEMIEVSLRDEMEERDAKVTEKVFPIKIGNKDSDPKFKGSGLIQAIQKSLIDAFPPVKNLMQNKGEADGKFGPATSVAIKSIQGIFGNKNMSGQLDKPLLDSILMLDQISDKNKDRIKKALSSLRTSYAVSESTRFAKTDYSLFESKYIDPDDLEEEIKKNLEGVDLESMVSKSMQNEESMANALAKMLRVGGFNKNAEAEDFLREDGTLKNSYPQDFVQGWMQALEENKEEENKDSFFWIEKEGDIGFLYAIKRLAGGYKKPYNWTGWVKMTKEENESSRTEFANWYISYYSNFGGLTSEQREKTIKNLFEYFDEYENQSEDKKVKRMLSYISEIKSFFGKNFKSDSFDNLKIGYVDKQTMDLFVKIAKKAAQVDDQDPDLGAEDFRILAIIVSMCLGSISYNFETEKWEHSLDVLKERVLSESILQRISKDKMAEDFGGGKDAALKNLIQFKEGSPVIKVTDSPKQLLMNYLGKIGNSFGSLIKKHIDRISLKDLEGKNVPAGLKVYVVKTDI
jgi:hypothetical protein